VVAFSDGKPVPTFPENALSATDIGRAGDGTSRMTRGRGQRCTGMRNDQAAGGGARDRCALGCGDTTAAAVASKGRMTSAFAAKCHRAAAAGIAGEFVAAAHSTQAGSWVDGASGRWLSPPAPLDEQMTKALSGRKPTAARRLVAIPTSIAWSAIAQLAAKAMPGRTRIATLRRGSMTAILQRFIRRGKPRFPMQFRSRTVMRVPGIISTSARAGPRRQIARQ
jgi:hypothetical protein